MAEKYTELQMYRMSYIENRKTRIIKRLEEINKEDQDPVILFETHKKLMEEKNDLVKEFDTLAEEYRAVIQARRLYEFYRREAYKLKEMWGFSDEKA